MDFGVPQMIITTIDRGRFQLTLPKYFGSIAAKYFRDMWVPFPCGWYPPIEGDSHRDSEPEQDLFEEARGFPLTAFSNEIKRQLGLSRSGRFYNRGFSKNGHPFVCGTCLKGTPKQGDLIRGKGQKGAPDYLIQGYLWETNGVPHYSRTKTRQHTTNNNVTSHTNNNKLRT